MFQIDLSLNTLIHFYLWPVMLGVVVILVSFIFLAWFLEKYPHATLSIFFELLYEKVYDFYSDILGFDASSRIKTYIVTLFFVIFFANIISVFVSFIAPIFWVSSSWEFFLSHIFLIPTSDMQFNIALSLFSTLLLLYIQLGTLGVKKFFYNYFPILWKGYIEIERGNMKSYLYYPLAWVAKIGDIIISLFLGFLDLVGLAAKVISLAFRLFGNMISGTVLLWMLLIGLSSFTQNLTWFLGGINFPIILPLIVYAQGILVAVIQAMVFPLLVAIFIRMASSEV